jgi:hypothetical protein
MHPPLMMHTHPRALASFQIAVGSGTLLWGFPAAWLQFGVDRQGPSLRPIHVRCYHHPHHLASWLGKNGKDIGGPAKKQARERGRCHLSASLAIPAASAFFCLFHSSSSCARFASSSRNPALRNTRHSEGKALQDICSRSLKELKA